MAEQETKKQSAPMRYGGQDLLLIKSLFKDNEPLLLALRKVFFQVELNDDDLNTLKVITSSDEAKKVLRKTYFPEIDLNAPFGQVIDLWLTVDSKDKDPEQVQRALFVRQRLMELIMAGLARLDNPSAEIKEKIIDYKPNFDQCDLDLYVEYTARNALISHTEFQLIQLMTLANQKSETLEEKISRMKKNSGK